MVAESSWMNKIMKQVKNECNKVRSIQHILSRKKHAVTSSVTNADKNNRQTAPPFGCVFTDHMLKMVYDKSRGGWQYPEITEFENISLHPAAKVLHYATTLFEGMKAYRGVDGKIRLFRPLLNLQRLNQSAERACLPKVDTHMLLRSIEKLISIDENFVPYSTDSSLYIRPTLIGTDPQLGVRENSNALLYVILSPCGSYFSGGFRSVRLYADPSFVRAWVGGCGDRKMGANYAPTIYVQKKAQEAGCDQALWLYGEDQQITEAGTMSVFLYYINDEGERELATPPLENGIILPSISRRSLLELSREWKEFKVSEKRISISDLIRLNNEKRVIEFFGAGTACIVTPIAEIYYKGNLIELPTAQQPDPLYARFFKTLSDIQYGRIEHPWAVQIEVDEEELKKYWLRATYTYSRSI